MKRLLGSSAVLVLASCAVDQSVDLSIAESEATVCGSGPTVKGVDVSYYQGTIDWAAAKADGVEYAFVRVSDGLGTEDTKFDQNWAGTRANGILRGAYQFFRPNQDAIAQANLLLSRMGTLEPDDLPPVIDVEAAGGMGAAQIEAQVRLWIDHVRGALGVEPIIYTGFYFWRDSVGAPDFTSSPLWHAQYTSAECPNIPPPWSDWAFWQFTSTGSVAGIAGNVDVNRFNGTRDQLLAMTVQPAPCGTLDASGGTIDDGDACFYGGGPAAFLRKPTDAGEGGDLVWTHAIDADADANYARWSVNLAEGGRYRVEVSTPAAYAESKQTRYKIRANGVETEVVIDQTAVDGWQTLGDFDFATGGDQFVYAGDNTGEPVADQVRVVFDAVKLTRLDPPSDDQPGEEPTGDEPPGEGGCSTGSPTGLVLGMLALLLVRRRR